MIAQAPWKNRIVGYADVDPAQLLASPQNFRRHPRNQQDALSGVIDEVGYVDPVLVQAGTDVVLDGHLRVELAMRTNQPTIPVKYVDLTDAEAALVLATFDPLSALAYHDQEQLDALLAELSTNDEAVQALLDSLTAPDFDANTEWTGMPGFQQENRESYQRIVVNFAAFDDVQEFARIIGQTLTDQTDSIWYPAQQPKALTHRYIGDAADAA